MPIELREKREDRRLCPVCYYPIPDGEEICRNCHPQKFLDSSASKKGAPRSR
jgi:predicted nucleic acid-binding Zn ribbon protein